MGGHDSDSSVGPGYFSSTRRGLLLFSFLSFARSAVFYFFFGVFICFFALALSLYLSFYFIFFVTFSLFHFLFYVFVFLCFPFSLFQGIGVAGVCMYVEAWHCTTAVYLVQRSCLCRSFVTTELVSLG